MIFYIFSIFIIFYFKVYYHCVLCQTMIYIDIEKEDSISVEGILMVKYNKTTYIVKYSRLDIPHTNEICKEMNYENLHSISYPCQLNKSENQAIEFTIERNECCNM